jgi:hypothetical protein
MTEPKNHPVPQTRPWSAHTAAVRSWRVPALAGVAALGLLLAGCSGGADGDEGKPSPVASSFTASGSGPAGETTSADAAGASTSGSPSGAASSAAAGPYEPASSTAPAKNVPVPEMPEAAKEPTKEGLEAALMFWWEAVFYLRQTGDVKPLASVSDEESCALCTDQIVRWDDIYSDGGWADTGLANVKMQFTKLDPDSLGGTTSFLVSEAPGELYRPNGERVGEAAGDGSKETPWVAAMVFDEVAGNWRVEDLEAQGPTP